MALIAECTGCCHVAPVPTEWIESRVQCPKCYLKLFLEPPEPGSVALVPAECLECGHHTWVPEDFDGANVLCPDCLNEIVLKAARQTVLAECVECGHRTQVAISRIGTWAKCPSCVQEIVLEPAESERVAKKRRPKPRSRKRTKPRKRPQAADSYHQRPVAAISRPNFLMAPAAPTTPKKIPVRATSPDADDESPSQWSVDPVSAIALFLSGAGLICSSVASLCILVLPLCVAALLSAIVGGILARRSQRFLYVPGVAAVATALFLLTAAFSPATLGKTYRAYRDRLPDGTAIHGVPLLGYGDSPALSSPDWVDAKHAALVQGALRVQVVNAYVGTVDLRNSSGKPTKSKEKYLVVNLRAHRTKSAEEFAAGAQAPQARILENPKLRLTDNTGKVYSEPRLDLETTQTGDPRGSHNFPVEIITYVAVFDAPSADMEFLHLEIPVASWGGKGVFQFTIPKGMIGTGPILDSRERDRDRR